MGVVGPADDARQFDALGEMLRELVERVGHVGVALRVADEAHQRIDLGHAEQG
jgi:hypothetical protein